MKIAELVVGLGIKGNDSAAKALSGVKGGLGEVKTMGFEAKAAIVAVVYGLERLMSQSAQMGTGLSNFNALTGIGTKELQQWQYAARQAGVSGEEVAGSMKAVQASMANMLMKGNAPEGYAMVANKVGLANDKLRDTQYVLMQLQKFAQSVPQDVGNQMLKSFGLSEGIIAAMRKDAFTPKAFAAAPTYSDNEVASLQKVDAAWSNLGQKIEMAMGHFSAAHGGKIVKDLSSITSSVIHLSEALVKLSDRFEVIATVGKVFEGIANTLKLASELMDKLGGGESKKGDLLYTPAGKEAVPGFAKSPFGKWITETFAAVPERSPESKVPNYVLPKMSSVPSQVHREQGPVTQHLHFQHEGKDPQKISDAAARGIKNAYRQNSTQKQVN